MKRLIALAAAVVLTLAPVTSFAAPPTPMFSAMEAPGSASTVAVALTGGCAVGSMGLIAVTGFSSPAPVSATDSKGNTWTLDSQGFGGPSLSGGIFRAPITTALAATDTITVTYGSAITKANVIAICQPSATDDATGKGTQGSSGSSDSTWTSSTSGSPPTNAARVFMATYMTGGFDTLAISGGTWTLAQGVAIGAAPWNGMAVYYQDVSAGATSTFTATITDGPTQWLDLWHALDVSGGGPAITARRALLGVGQ